jgi:hypothetical protein
MDDLVIGDMTVTTVLLYGSACPSIPNNTINFCFL